MAAIKGLNRNQSQYITHNYCSACEKWIADKPLFCPECNKRTRNNTHYVNGRYKRV